MINLRCFALLISLSLFSACGYRWQPEYPDGVRPTLTVPYIEGDQEGVMTAEVILGLSASGLVDVLQYGGDYRLGVKILSQAVTKIGFRRDPQKVYHKVRKNLLACEARKEIRVEVTLYEGGSDEIAFGPFEITADADYDYVDGDSIRDLTFVNTTGSTVTVLPFSLGQLEPVDSAQEASLVPLYNRLAKKIVDAISSAF